MKPLSSPGFIDGIAAEIEEYPEANRTLAEYQADGCRIQVWTEGNRRDVNVRLNDVGDPVSDDGISRVMKAYKEACARHGVEADDEDASRAFLSRTNGRGVLHAGDPRIHVEDGAHIPGGSTEGERDAFSIDCTGDVVAGDEIEFTEAVFGGGRANPKFLGERTVRAKVVRESYGADKQQHTFTLQVRESSGFEALTPGVYRRKGRNVYGNGTMRKPWPDEAARDAARAEKHARGDQAREKRSERKKDKGLGW